MMLTQGEFARKLDITFASVNRYKNSKSILTSKVKKIMNLLIMEVKMSNYFITNKSIDPINISEEDFCNIHTESKTISRYKQLIISWLTYHDSVKLIDEFKQKGAVKLLDEFDLDNFALCNAYVGNALNAFYMFEQFCERYFTCFKDGIKQNIYDNNFEYRFIYNLRTYSTHNELPILKISYQFDRANKKYFNPKFMASKKNFCATKSLQKKVKDEVGKIICEEDIDVYKYLEKVDEILFFAVIKIILNDSSKIIDIYNNWYSFDRLKDKSTNLCLWNNSNIEIYMTSKLYMTYKHFDKHLLKQDYCHRYIGTLSTQVTEFCNTLKQILHIAE